MTDRFKKRYPLHDRHSVHTDGSMASASRFRSFLDQVSPDDTIMVHSLNRLARDIHDLGRSLQANGVHITIVCRPVENGERSAE